MGPDLQLLMPTCMVTRQMRWLVASDVTHYSKSAKVRPGTEMFLTIASLDDSLSSFTSLSIESPISSSVEFGGISFSVTVLGFSGDLFDF